MPTIPIPLADGWPHKHFSEAPEELHIQPRTAYYMHDGKLVFVRLEKLTAEDVAPFFDAWNTGTKPHEM